MVNSNDVVAISRMETVVEELHAVVVSALDHHWKYMKDGNEEDASFVLHALFDALGNEIGYVDGISCLNGVPMGDRVSILTQAIKEGKKGVIADHDNCRCPALEELKKEVYPS